MKKPIRIIAIATLLQCFLCVSVFGQNLSLKSSHSNGAILDGIGFIEAKATGNLKRYTTGTMLVKSSSVPGSDRVTVDFGLYFPKKYRYNGKVYETSISDSKCGYSIFETFIRIKVKATIKVGGETYTKIIDDMPVRGLPGAHLIVFELPKIVERNTISLVSILVESIPSPSAEGVLRKYEECLKKEKDKKNENKEKIAEDFWSGGEEKTLVSETSDKDFWNGEENRGNSTKKTTTNNANNNFWAGNEMSKDGKSEFWASYEDANKKEIKYNIKHEGTLYWVEDEEGKILISKVPYDILSYKEGLAYVEKTIEEYEEGTYYVDVYETFYVNNSGDIIPPVTKNVNIRNRVFLYAVDPNQNEEEQRARINEKARNELMRISSKYEAMGYTVH